MDTAADAYTSFYVLFDHINTDRTTDSVRARRSSDHIASVHAQISAVTTTFREVDYLYHCIESGFRAFNDSKNTSAALEEAF